MYLNKFLKVLINGIAKFNLSHKYGLQKVNERPRIDDLFKGIKFGEQVVIDLKRVLEIWKAQVQ